MKGKSLFRIGRPLLDVGAWVFSFSPSFFSNLIWDCARPYSNKLAVALRYVILKSRAASCGENVYIGSNVVLKNLGNLNIGENVSIHDFCYLDAYGVIQIGNDVSIAHASSLVSFDHTWANDSTPIKYNPVRGGEIRIENDVWIGAGVRILANVHIESRTVIAAGSVVPRGRYPARQIYGGIPARSLKAIDP